MVTTLALNELRSCEIEKNNLILFPQGLRLNLKMGVTWLYRLKDTIQC